MDNSNQDSNYPDLHSDNEEDVGATAATKIEVCASPYCKCPDSMENENDSDIICWTQCDSCNQWFHDVCEQAISKDSNQDFDYICSLCSFLKEIDDVEDPKCNEVLKLTVTRDEAESILHDAVEEVRRTRVSSVQEEIKGIQVQQSGSPDFKTFCTMIQEMLQGCNNTEKYRCVVLRLRKQNNFVNAGIKVLFAPYMAITVQINHKQRFVVQMCLDSFFKRLKDKLFSPPKQSKPSNKKPLNFPELMGLRHTAGAIIHGCMEVARFLLSTNEFLLFKSRVLKDGPTYATEKFDKSIDRGGLLYLSDTCFNMFMEFHVISDRYFSIVNCDARLESAKQDILTNRRVMNLWEAMLPASGSFHYLLNVIVGKFLLNRGNLTARIVKERVEHAEFLKKKRNAEMKKSSSSKFGLRKSLKKK